MKRNPIYVFNGLEATGIDAVPLEASVQINDSDNYGTPKIVQLISKAGLTQFTTIAQFLGLTDTYIDLNEATEIPSELEKLVIDTGATTITGWRMLGREPAEYGQIGNGAIDFSDSLEDQASSGYGATGENSIAAGARTKATAYAAIATGTYTIANQKGMLSIGNYNTGLGCANTGDSSYSIFEAGCGLGLGARANALEISSGGHLIAPELTIDKINNVGLTSLVTKEYSDQNLDSKFEVAGGTITGNLIVAGENPTLENSFVNEGLAQFNQKVTFSSAIQVGTDNSTSGFNPIIEFYNISAGPSDYLASIYYNVVERDFFVNTSDRLDNRLWHSGNDGAGSGLDADMLHGVAGTDIATTQYVDDGLGEKYNTTGGLIDGTVTINDNATIQGLLSTSILSVSQNSNFQGQITAQENIVASKNITVGGNLLAPNIYGNTMFSHDVNTAGTLTTDGLFRAKGDALFDPDSDRRSGIYLTDFGNTGHTTRFYWDSDLNTFRVQDRTASYEVYHSGNLPVAATPSFDSLTDTPNTKIPNNFIRVTPDGTALTYTDTIDADLFIDDGTTNGDLDKTWSADKLYDTFLGKLSTNSGTMSGSLNIGNNLDVSNDVTVGSQLIVQGSLDTTDIISANVDFAGNITANGIIQGAIVQATASLKSGLTNIIGNDISEVLFTDTTSGGGVVPRIYWNNDSVTPEFMLDDAGSVGNVIYHSGNFSADGADLAANNVFTGTNEFTAGVEINTLPLEVDTINLVGNAALNFQTITTGDSNLFGMFGDHKTSFGYSLPTASTVGVYWDPNQNQWVVDGVYLDLLGNEVLVQGARVWCDANFSPDTKLDKTGGLVQGDVIITANIADPGTFGFGDLSVERNITGLGDLDITGNTNLSNTTTDDLQANGDIIFSGSNTGSQTFTVDSQVETTDIQSDTLTISASDVNFSNLPTSDPGVPGQLWDDNGVLMISQ